MKSSERKQRLVSNEISRELSEISEFIENIERAPQWRDVSLTELIERLGGVLLKIDSALGTSSSVERAEFDLLEGLLRSAVVSYKNEFGHYPYRLLSQRQVKRTLGINEIKLRSNKIKDELKVPRGKKLKKESLQIPRARG